MLKIMHQCFEFDDKEVNTILICVLSVLPLDCWNSNVLGKIVSKIGKPILTIKLTYAKGRLSYAHFHVEVDASKKLVQNIVMKLPTSKSRVQPVEYEHEPKFCSNCKILGHKTAVCNIKDHVVKQNRLLSLLLNRMWPGQKIRIVLELSAGRTDYENTLYQEVL